MKRAFTLFLSLLCLIAVVPSCQKAPELTITSPANIELSADGSSGSITFTANRDWRVSSSDSWVTVSPSSGAASDGPVTVNVRCNANTTYEDRTATVTVTMEGLTQTVTVRQPANLGIVLPTQAFDLQSGAKNIDVTVQANVDYTVEVSANWIKQTGTKALTSKTLSFSIEENKTYDAREGKITIKPKQAGVVEQVISVKQAQKEALNVEKTSYEMPYGGGEIEIKVEASVGFDVTPNVDWLHYVSTKALTNSTVLIKVDENETYSSREGKIEIAQQNGSLKHTITVQQAGRIAVTSVELDQTSLTLKPEETATLVATVKPDNATDKTVIWTSSDASIAAVDESGKVTAIKVGSATITAKAGDKTTECKVTILIPVSSIELNKTELSLYVDESETLIATVKPDNATEKTVTWSSSNAEVAAVDANGKVTAKKEGSATITAKAGDKTAECKVSVGIAVTSVELNKPSITLAVGNSETLVATVKPDNASDKTVTWTSSDSEVATVDETGKVTALKVGNATITASAGFKSAECKVTVYIPVSSIELSKTKLYLNIGESETLVATIKPDDATDKSIVWTSSDDTIATVDDNGKVTAIKEGKATIKAKAGEKEAECSVSVGIAVTGIKLDNTSLEIRVDDTATLTATVSPDNATDKTVTWTSSDATVASVDKSGTVKAKKVGTATITATAGEKSATCAVTVKKKVPAGAVDLGITIYPEEGDSYELFWAECNLDASKPEEYGGYYAWGEIETKNEYTWYTYKWCTGGYLSFGDGGKLTKYNNREGLGVIDEKQQLDPEDDAAHVKLGGKWRIPTKDEFQALQKGCTNVEETLNGVKGRRFTSRVNGNSIFLPYAGRAADTSIADAGKQGDYSTSSLRVMNGEYGDHASYLYMSKDYVYVASLTREIGFSIRPVTE